MMKDIYQRVPFLVGILGLSFVVSHEFYDCSFIILFSIYTLLIVAFELIYPLASKAPIYTANHCKNHNSSRKHALIAVVTLFIMSGSFLIAKAVDCGCPSK